MTAPAILELLHAVGFDAVTAETGLPMIEKLLRDLNEQLPDVDVLRRQTVISMVTERLKDLGIVDARRLVRLALAAPTNGAMPPPPPAPLESEPGALLEAGRPVLDAPDVLALVSDYVRAAGYAGDTAPPRVIYLALTSRLLERPTNLLLSGPSAGGKNYSFAVVLPLMPADAFYFVHGQSPLAMMYSKEDFAHRTVVISEAAAFHEDGIGASLLRGLAWDGELRYDTVIDGAPVHLHKHGPTGLITTSTRDVEAELATRLWTVPIPDDPVQTRKVLRAAARAAEGRRATPSIPANIFVAAQQWLTTVGAREVVVPFATALAELLPDDEVRLRRDFTQLLTLIKAHALLHQRQRERDDRGRVLATDEDYEQVQALVEPMFALSLSPGLSAEIRATVEAVASLVTPQQATVTNTELAARLKLSESATWRRVQKAVRKRYLINDEARKHQPARLRIGNPLPTPGRLLPLTSEIHANAQTANPTSDSAEGYAFARPFASGGDGGATESAIPRTCSHGHPMNHYRRDPAAGWVCPTCHPAADAAMRGARDAP